ncbi:cell wall anchor protein [Chryseobacterium chendengshani]|uniref:cell wall anchor protein n=1 Tax=Chryseobacterium sp. LJ756 TaxID=2864113 RepID=UPI001C641330|nr:cell wall anchor protein [Chryseobacterium sp. LJ756]MBW7675114.1 cell wall anchor protein [Chryseobacterium sp. LJ756]
MKKTLSLIGLIISLLFYSQVSNTQTRNDAGAPTFTSGFYEAQVPVNFPVNAASWWHLLDVRHSNTNNNYGMQIAGSFYDQDFWFRKTNNDGSQPWRKAVMETSAGNVRIGLNDTFNSDSSLRVYKTENTSFEVANSNGFLQIARSNCNGCYGANVGETVIRNIGTNSQGSSTIIFSIPNDANDGASYIGINDGANGTWAKFFNNATARFNGKIFAKEVEVKANVWADYVFNKDYQLLTLDEVEKHINKNGHLPNVPSAKVILEKGINVAEMDAKLLEKIEELTLYSIEQNKQLKSQYEEINELKKQVQKLMSTHK